jgi:hypothetical protein
VLADFTIWTRIGVSSPCTTVSLLSGCWPFNLTLTISRPGQCCGSESKRIRRFRPNPKNSSDSDPDTAIK